MTYSIGEVAKMLNITTSTLRYYEKEGLLPTVERKTSGIRTFTELDMKWLEVIHCLKNTRMPIKDIKVFVDWCNEGDSSIEQRYNMFLERKKTVEDQIAELKKTLEVIDYKCWYYKVACEAGTEKVHKNNEPTLCGIESSQSN